MFGNIILAEKIEILQNNSYSIRNASSVFTALSFPAFISMDSLITMNGISESKNYDLKVIVREIPSDTTYAPILVQAQFFVEDADKLRLITSTNVLNLNKVPIRNEGLHELVVIVDNEEIAAAKFDVVKEELV